MTQTKKSPEKPGRFITVPDAAKHLSSILEEEVTEADVLRLVLDGHLKLSVNFLNHTKAKRGQIVTWEETEWWYTTPFSETNVPKIQLGGPVSGEKILKTIPPKLEALKDKVPEDERKKLLYIMKSHEIDNGRFVDWDKEIITIKGVWDLSMIGGERLDVEHAYQVLTGGPEVTLVCMDGCVVGKPGGKLCWLQENGGYSNDYKIDQPGSKAHLAWLKTVGEEKLGKTEVERLLNQHEEERNKFLTGDDRERTYFPAGGLPQDSVLVVRTAALREFEQNVADLDGINTKDTEENIIKPLATTERHTLLIIIAALCDHLAIPHQERGAAAQIARRTEEFGVPVSDDAIRRALEKIPDAIEARSK